jgi:hypothetical protein
MSVWCCIWVRVSSSLSDRVFRLLLSDPEHVKQVFTSNPGVVGFLIGLGFAN